MKSKWSKIGLYILCVLIFFAIVFFALRPTYNALNLKINTVKDEYINFLEKYIGIHLTVEKISPKIIFGLDLKNIEAVDSLTGKKVAFIKKANIKYSLLTLLQPPETGFLTAFLKNITVNDATFNLDFNEDSAIQQKINALFGKGTGGNDGHEPSGENVENVENLQNIDNDKNIENVQNQQNVENLENDKKKPFKFSIPCGITIKNLSVQYAQKQTKAKFDFKKLALIPKVDKVTNQKATTLNMNGKVSASAPIPFLNAQDEQFAFETNFSSKIMLSENFDGSIANLQISTPNSNVFSLADLNFAIKYKESAVSALVFNSNSPFDFRVNFDFLTNDISATLNADKFDPFAFVSVKNKKSKVQDFTGTIISGSYEVLYNLKSTELYYNANGKIFVPKSIAKMDISTQFDFSGDLRATKIRRLHAESSFFEAEYSGTFDIKNLVPEGELFAYRIDLPSKKTMNFEMYFSPLSKGFLCFVPQLIIGEDFLTALELTCVINKESIDYDFTAYDYSHYEVDLPGFIELHGSFFFDDQTYLQTGISFENMFVGSFVKLISNFLKDGTALEELSKGLLAPYIMSEDLYILTDFKELSFNLPYAIVANTQKDGEMLLLSLDGNESTLQVSKLELAIAGQTLSATISADVSNNFEDCFFSTSFLLNQIPYSFSGAYAKNESLVLSGDYGVNIDINLHNKEFLEGSLFADNLPLSAFGFIVSSTFDTQFSFASLDDWVFTINEFSVTEDSGKLPNSPSFAVTGEVNNLGAQFDTIQVKDSISVLQGSGNANWNIDDNILHSAFLKAELKSDIFNERLVFDFECSNPFMVDFSEPDFLGNLYVTGTGNIDSLFMSHFLSNQDEKNTINVDFSVLGPLNNPLINAEISETSLTFNNRSLVANGGVILEDFVFSCNELNFNYQELNIENLNGSLDVKTFNGFMNGKINFTNPNVKAFSPFEITFSPFDDGKLDNFIATLNLQEITTSFSPPIKDYLITVVRTQKRTDFSIGSSDSVIGYILDNGEIFASSKKDFPLLFEIGGKIDGINLDLSVSDFKMDLLTFKELFANDFLFVNSCNIEGDLQIQGLLSDPDFHGKMFVNNVDISIPTFMPNSISAVSIPIVANENIFTLEKTFLTSDKTNIEVDAIITMDRWDLGNMVLNVNTEKGKSLFIDSNLPFVNLRANTSCNLQMELKGSNLSVNGTVDADDTVVCLTLSDSSSDAEKKKKSSSEKSDFSVSADVILNISAKSKVYYPSEENPIIRGLVFAREPIHLVLDTATGDFSLTGEMVLRGGELLYLNRNFYLREGQVTLNESATSFDPTITFRAETPERDEYGEIIKIILKSDAQRLSSLNPVLTSDPIKSDDEIRSLLGQVIFGDNQNGVGVTLGELAASGVDYFVQSSVFRQLENQLRDFFNFDIFSFRTQFLKQAIIQALDSEDETKQFSAGNYFDNTTVYIGKYIGTTLYFDAMLRLVYKDDPINVNSKGKLMFQPELGLELPTPFANIRWSIVPDITTAQNLWVPDSSISLSWKFSF